MNKLETKFAGLTFKNPVVLASGTCGFGRELNEYFNIEVLGGLSSKGLLLRPHGGNKGVRIWETTAGIMNSVGLENPGVDAFIENELPWLKTKDIINIVNLGGHSIEDYEEGIEKLNAADIHMVELNISCPNVKEGGMNFGIKTQAAREVVKRVRRICRHPLTVKLSPNAEDVVSLAKMCEAEGADGLSLTNTYLALAIDIENKKPVFDNVYAGLSGPAIKPISLRMVHQVSKAVTIPVMGIGGITTWQDAVEFIMAGATLVQIGTGSFMRPTLAPDVIEGLGEYADKEDLGNISEIRGII